MFALVRQPRIEVWLMSRRWVLIPYFTTNLLAEGWSVSWGPWTLSVYREESWR